ncbi:MFS transporter [Rugamonas sp. FT82W]|uniref:MFS transporter n=1 Tax=Duganella vulcania TaxID=2692166 RepID=A0A845FXC1_9BURK|nr:MFS transporter [Duganella vulcania]MYM85882.1 MFS transporter [Duganella vulcania]
MNQPQTIDVQAFIDARRMSTFQWSILVFCFIVLALDGLDTASIGFVAPMLIKEWGIARADLSPILSASLVGLALGALAAGPLADRFGRRKMIVSAVLVFGVCSLACSWADSVLQLTVLRWLTGLGLGAAMPNAVTLLAEYAPARHRSLLVTTMFCGFTLGSAGGGLLSAILIPAFGWRSVMAVGGVLPLLLFPLLLWYLPESIRFKVMRRHPSDEIAALMSRIGGKPLPASAVFVQPQEEQRAGSPVALLFAPRYGAGTLLLWLTAFMGMLIIYLLGSWMPTLIKDAGFPIERAALVTALFQLGGTAGSICVGWGMDRIGRHKSIALSYVFGAACIYGVGRIYADLVLLGACVFSAGFFMSGSQTGMNALAAAFYPTSGRATGVSWMLAVARLGAILGAVAGGNMLAAGWGLSGIFSVLALPALVAAVAIAVKGGLRPAAVEGAPMDRGQTLAGH